MTTGNEDTSNLDDFIAEMEGKPVEAPVAEEPPVEVDETPEEAPTPDDGEETPETPEEEAQKKGRSTADRIKKLTAEKKAAERAAAEVVSLRAEIEALKKAATPAPLTETPKTDNNEASGAPDPANYPYGELDRGFMRDLARFEVQAFIAEDRESQRKANEATQQAQAAQREVAALQEKATAIETVGRAKFEDFDEVTTSGALAGISKEAAQLIAESDLAADAFYHLASNPEEAARVFGQPLLQQARWLAAFEVKASAPPPAKVPKAPPPLATPTRGSGGRYEVPDDTDDLAAFERKFFSRG